MQRICGCSEKLSILLSAQGFIWTDMNPSEKTPADWKERVSREILRLYALPDRWLGRELLKLARSTRESFPDVMGNPADYAEYPYFCWQIIPEMARRLGSPGLHPNEAANPALRNLPDRELRSIAGENLKAGGVAKLARYRGIDEVLHLAVLGNPVRLGNPVAMAADRLAPASPRGRDMNDWIARQVRILAEDNGHEATLWNPALLSRRPARIHMLHPAPGALDIALS
jgi:hypothetical protein